MQLSWREGLLRAGFHQELLERSCYAGALSIRLEFGFHFFEKIGVLIFRKS
ncbi:hypothetical protein D3C83_321460 [compost metagenome]